MNIYQKLVEVRKSVPYLQKSADGPQFKYVSSSQVLANVKAKMDELNLLLIPRITKHEVREYIKGDKGTVTYFTELEIEFTWINADAPEEKVSCEWYGQGIDIAGEKGVGKALTYAEKYFMLKFFNIPTDKDDPDSFQDKHTNEEKKQKLTEAQVKRAYTIGTNKGLTNQQVKEWVLKKFNKTSLKDLSKKEYDELCSAIEKIEKQG